MDMIEYCAHDPYTCWRDEVKPGPVFCVLIDTIKIEAFSRESNLHRSINHVSRRRLQIPSTPTSLSW